MSEILIVMVNLQMIGEEGRNQIGGEKIEVV